MGYGLILVFFFRNFKIFGKGNLRMRQKKFNVKKQSREADKIFFIGCAIFEERNIDKSTTFKNSSYMFENAEAFVGFFKIRS